MKTKMGLWIDHRKAVIAAVSDKEAEMKVILSKTDRQPGRIDGARSTTVYESLLVAADDVNERKFTEHLNRYYDEVAACLRESEAILIFGPGEAKGQLQKRLQNVIPKDCVVVLETADKMTDRQIAARVRDYFKKENPVSEL